MRPSAERVTVRDGEAARVRQQQQYNEVSVREVKSLKSRGWLVLAAVLAWCVLVGVGCGKSKPEIRHYQLAVSEPATSESRSGAWSLGVEYLTADAAYDDARIVYRKSPYRVDYYHYHRWSAPPSVMVTDALRRGLQRSGRFKQVSSGYSKGVDAVLRGRVVAIEEVDRSEQEWVARLVLDLQLEDASTGAVLWTQVIEREEAVSERNPEGVARALSVALSGVIVELPERLLEARAASMTGQTGEASRIGSTFE